MKLTLLRAKIQSGLEGINDNGSNHIKGVNAYNHHRAQSNESAVPDSESVLSSMKSARTHGLR